MDLMPIDRVDDWDRRLARQDAFWDRAVIDRPVVTIVLPKPTPDHPPTEHRRWPCLRDRWMDTAYQVELALARALNNEYLGDALPRSHPNLGPEVFSAFFGCEMEYGERTSWSIPNLNDWGDVDRLQLSRDNVYWRKLVEMTDALLDAGRGIFYTGMTDWHSGGDAVAAFRDPVNLNFDMIERPGDVKALLARINADYFEVFDFFYDKLAGTRQPITTWLGVVSTRKWYVPSNDFSCMISKAMFDDVFLPGIIEECRFFEASCYHLDGPDALRHLDSLLDIPELNAIQWVYGAGQGRASDWMPVYQRCQAAGKGLVLYLDVDELEFFMETLRPEGLHISLGGVTDREHADAILKNVSRWT